MSPTAASMRAWAWLPRTSSRSSRRSKAMLAFSAAAAGSMRRAKRAPRPPRGPGARTWARRLAELAIVTVRGVAFPAVIAVRQELITRRILVGRRERTLR